VNWFGILSDWIPILCCFIGVSLLGYAVWRRKKRLPCLRFVITAILLLLIAIAPVLLLFFAVLLGFGPVPT